MLAAVTSLVASQAPQPADNTIKLKGKAPVSNTVLRVSLPKPQVADLPNGLQVMVLEDRRAPQVTMQMVIRGAGGYYDPPDHVGLAQFTAANLREGTATRTSPEIAEYLERIAATVNVTAAMSSEEATLTASSLREHFEQVMDLAADLILAPAFPEQELARYKAQTRAQLMQQRAQPNFLAFERFSQVVADGHPDGRTAPTRRGRSTRRRAPRWSRSTRRTTCPITRSLPLPATSRMAAALKAVQSRFGGWAKAGAAPPTVSDPVGARTIRVCSWWRGRTRCRRASSSACRRSSTWTRTSTP